MVECDEIAVPTTLWDRARAGDADAKKDLRVMVSGLVLYVHALYYPTPHVLVTARELCTVLNDGLTLTLGFDN